MARRSSPGPYRTDTYGWHDPGLLLRKLRGMWSGLCPPEPSHPHLRLPCVLVLCQRITDSVTCETVPVTGGEGGSATPTLDGGDGWDLGNLCGWMCEQSL